MVITYIVCIPLGMVKAIKHSTPIDTYSSILVFFGYSIPDMLWDPYCCFSFPLG